MSNHARSRGFTLIELMIAVAVVAILAAVAYPSFTEHLRKQRRAEAQQILMDVASRQQQHRLDTRSFVTGADVATTGASIPESLKLFYEFRFDPEATETAFTAAAVPIGAQASDVCGTLTVDQNGRKRSAEPGPRCW
jgi:type IV pilus assembly protein PilE